MRRLVVFILALGAGAVPAAFAHEVRPAYLELRQTAPDAFDVLWKVPSKGENLRLGLYVRLPRECENTTDPRGVFTGGSYVERWSIRHPQALVGSSIYIDGLKTTLTDVLVRIEWLDGTTATARLLPANPTLVVEASPGRWEVARTYLGLGVEHILLGIDHLLFVLALLLLVRGYKRVVGTITAFTVAHSITLGLATLGFVHMPGPPVEAVIALSIVFVASGNCTRPGGNTRPDDAVALGRVLYLWAVARFRVCRCAHRARSSPESDPAGPAFL